MRIASFTVILLLGAGTISASAQEAPRGLAREGSPIFKVTPRLAQEETRQFAQTSLLQAEQTQSLEIAASDLILEYSSDEPFEAWVSFLNENPAGGEGAIIFNPYHTLKMKLEPQSHGRISLDLTRSPAWSPFRDQYLLHVFGKDGQAIEIFDLAVRPPTFLRTIRAAVTHLNFDEPVLLSSVNFLWGYRVLDMSVSLLLGLLLTAVVMACLARNSKFSHRNLRQFPNTKQCLAAIFLFFLLYDARFSFDLARTTAQDLRQWYGDYQYRQLGPVHAVSAYLRTERERFQGDMKVAVCYDGTDFLEKQLRYMLYPTPVEGVEDLWSDATHAVFIDTERGSTPLTTGGMVEEGNAVSCGTYTRPAGQLLRSFSQNSRVIRFSDRSI